MTESEVAELKRWRLDVEVRQELTVKERLDAIKKAKEEDPECTFTPRILPRPPADKTDEEGGGVHERLATEAKFRIERKEKLKKKYESMAKVEDEELQKDLTFKPKITPHPVQDGDDRKDPEKGPCFRMYEDFIHRENRWLTRWKKEGKPLPKKKAENNEPPPPMPEDDAISFAEEALTDLNTAWLLQNLSEVDDLARLLFDRARKSVSMTMHMTRRILTLILDAFQMSLNDLEFHSWFAALKNEEEEIDRKPFVFLVRSVLRTKLTTPLRTHSFGRSQSRMTPRGLRTPSKAKSPMKNSMRMCALTDQPSEYATVVWTCPVPTLSVSLNRTSQTYRVEELHTIRGFHWHSRSITGVATPPVELDPIMPQFVEPPAGATHYSFAHPPIHAAPMAQSLKRRKDPRMHFLIYGGFLLLGRDGAVLATMALSPTKVGKDSYRFYLAPRHHLPDAVCEALMNGARLRPTTLAPFTEAPGWEQSLPSSTGDGVRSCWLTSDAWYPISKFKWPKLPHGALAYVHADGTGSYVPVMCYSQKCCGHRWEAMQGSVQALTLPLVLRDVAAHIVQWSDIPELTRTAKGFSYYCHALYRDSLVDVDGYFSRARFEEIMSDLHKLCGIPEPFDEFMEATQESLTEAPDLESENATEVEFILAMRHLLDSKSAMMEERLAGHLGDTLKGLSGSMEPESVPPNGMSLAWVIPEVPDLEIEVSITERTYRVTRTDATGDDVWDWHLHGLLSEVQITDAETAGVDDEATIFAYAAPIPHLAKVLDLSRPSHAFLAYGGFVYMTNNYRVVHVRALSGKRITEDSTRLIFSAAVPCSLPLRFFPARRLHPTSVHLPHSNFEPTSHCAWLLPDEAIPLPCDIPHGAFFYSGAPPYSPSERDVLAGSLRLLVCGNARCCGKYWKPSVATMCREVQPGIINNEIELLLKAKDIFDRVREDGDPHIDDRIPLDAFAFCNGQLIDALGLPANCKENAELWCDVTLPDGSKWITEDGFLAALQSLLQFSLTLAARDPNMVAGQARLMQETRDACHDALRDFGDLPLLNKVAVQLMVDLRHQCYTVRNPELLRLGLGNLTGPLSALCQVAEGAREVFKKAGTHDVHYYAFAYPMPNVASLLDNLSDPRQGFLAMGGFVYLDSKCSVVQIDAIKFSVHSKASQVLSFGEVEILPPDSVLKLYASGRFQLLRAAEEEEPRAEWMAWLMPGEYLVTPSLMHGALAYCWLTPEQEAELLAHIQKERAGGLSELRSSGSLGSAGLSFEPQAVLCRIVCSSPRCCGEYRRGSAAVVPLNALSSTPAIKKDPAIPSKPNFYPTNTGHLPRTPTSLNAVTPRKSPALTPPQIPTPPPRQATSDSTVNGGRWVRTPPGQAERRDEEAASGGVTP